MRWIRTMVAVASLAAALLAGTAVPGAASQPVSPMVTDGDSFVEVDQSGKLVHWRRSGEKFIPWRTSEISPFGIRAITSLDATTFLVLTDNGGLERWRLLGDAYIVELVGAGWHDSRMITGLGPKRFLELTARYELVLWEFTPDGRLTRSLVGTGWGDTRMLIGLGHMAFLQVKHDGTVSEWDEMREFPLLLNLSDARLSAGLDRERFVVVTASTGELVEYQGDLSGDFVPTVRDKDWSHARLIG